MCRNQPYTETTSRTTGTIFYRHLQSQSVISTNTFSVYMADTNTQSVVLYGASDFATYSAD